MSTTTRTDATTSVRTTGFAARHIGPSDADVQAMLATLGVSSLEELMRQTVPTELLRDAPLSLPEPLSEEQALDRLAGRARQNRVIRSCIGAGYYDTFTPAVILRNILENPGWYTQYTPYQAEIAQGRLEALLNFQTMVSDLTALPLTNASLLDEATAAAEAMTMARALAGQDGAFFAADDCHPQTLALLRARARWLGIELIVGDARRLEVGARPLMGVLLQYPGTDGAVFDYTALIEQAHSAGAIVVMACDLLALALLKPPGELGADIAIGSTQRFGIPMGFGGPHAAYMSTRTAFARKMPGRIVGVSKDAAGRPAYRLSIQTREQHIRREKATSNICTAQVLLAVMAGMYGAYHGPDGIRGIAQRTHDRARSLAAALVGAGHTVRHAAFFDTLRVGMRGLSQSDALKRALAAGYNLRPLPDGDVGISLDETTTAEDVAAIAGALGGKAAGTLGTGSALPPPLLRSSTYLTHPVFNSYHSETEMLRYITRLQSRDLSLAQSMIPLGSCTMKLNATSEMLPVTWSAIGRMHPMAPADQWRGYAAMFSDLEAWLGEITGLPAVSLQPNAGSQGEYAGLATIRSYLVSKGQAHRTVCLIPESAHGTNPASAVMAGFTVVGVNTDPQGSIDIVHLRELVAEHREHLGAMMITYPSTFGVFETTVIEACKLIHEAGGQVYMDGANMNAQVGLCRPGDFGMDVCHLNLHKTFCIPHGGGGPGMGPICAAEHLRPHLPGDPLNVTADGAGPVSAARYGSASILVISWMYIAMMGAAGLRRATEVAILNANYMAGRLRDHYRTLFTGEHGRVAHEFIVDVRAFEASAGIRTDDIAKRLMDYGFHAPTVSWPVPGTMMIEPTESESRAELDRFCQALIAIRGEIADIEAGRSDRNDNPLKNAPHTAEKACADVWPHPYSRTTAAFPAPWLRHYKFWPAVARIDNPYGDRHLFCTCPPMEAFK